MKNQLLIAFAIVIGVAISACKKNETAPVTTGVYFTQVKAILQNNCNSCHLSTGTWSGRPVAFDNDSTIANDYAAIKASVADPATFTNKRMPQGGTLSQSDIDIIIAWYNKGGKISD